MRCSRIRCSRILALAAVTLLLGGAAFAQFAATVEGNAGVTHQWLTAESLGLSTQLSIALPPAPHLAPFWDAIGAGFDRVQGHAGGSVHTALSVWISTAPDAAHGNGAVLIADGGVGRRWGVGLSGFTSLGLGAGWNFHGKLPYIEFRRRAGFHLSSPVDDQVVIGIHWILFG